MAITNVREHICANELHKSLFEEKKKERKDMDCAGLRPQTSKQTTGRRLAPKHSTVPGGKSGYKGLLS